jgi:hypothetical protein
MRKEQILPTLLIIIDICAALGYIPTGDWRKVIYWVAAGCLTTVVTF